MNWFWNRPGAPVACPFCGQVGAHETRPVVMAVHSSAGIRSLKIGMSYACLRCATPYVVMDTGECFKAGSQVPRQNPIPMNPEPRREKREGPLGMEDMNTGRGR